LARGVTPLAAQQVLTLAEALSRAERTAYANRIADGSAEAEAGRALALYRGILPSARLESGYVATTDPLGAFGFVLRQRAVTPAAFAPDRLNNPSVTRNLGAGLVVEQPLFNADAWLGRQAAARASAAARAGAEWTRSGTAVEVVRAYWGAVLAREGIETLTAAEQAAGSHQRQAEALVRQGMATRSDALLAAVKAGEVRAQLLAARSRARLAHRSLAVLLGNPSDTAFALPVTLPSTVTGETESDSLEAGRSPRPDLVAARWSREAAEADARRATALYLPRLNGFGRLDWNTPGTPFGGKSAWTVGVMLSWSPFAGGSELAEVRAAKGRRQAAQAAAEAAEAQADLQVAAARESLALALARLDIATEAVAQAAEAHRIVGRKYDGGLATVMELFDAGAAETASELARSAARYDALVARAELQRAEGRDVRSEK
jgi:outer membrane protein TolC